MRGFRLLLPSSAHKEGVAGSHLCVVGGGRLGSGLPTAVAGESPVRLRQTQPILWQMVDGRRRGSSSWQPVVCGLSWRELGLTVNAAAYLGSIWVVLLSEWVLTALCLDSQGVVVVRDLRGISRTLFTRSSLLVDALGKGFTSPFLGTHVSLVAIRLCRLHQTSRRGKVGL